MKKGGKSFKKLADNRGESFAEVMVALLISVLALMILAGMINGAATLIRKTSDEVSRYISEENVLAGENDSDASGTGEAVIRIRNTDGTERTVLPYDGAGDGGRISVKYFINDEGAGDPVISYK